MKKAKSIQAGLIAAVLLSSVSTSTHAGPLLGFSAWMGWSLLCAPLLLTPAIPFCIAGGVASVVGATVMPTP